MDDRVGGQADPSSRWPARSPSERLRHIGRQVQALMSQHSSLTIYKRAIERHLASIAAQIHEPDVVLIPRTVFLLVELRGSGGVCDHLEQIARLVHEAGYWKPHERVQNYHRQDVYHLGKSAQSLFDDSAVLARRVEHLHARLEDIKERRQMEAETTPQGVFQGLAATADTAQVQGEVEAIVELLEQGTRSGWFRWLFVPRRRMRNHMREAERE